MSSVVVSAPEIREQLILSHMPQVRFLALRLHRRCPPEVALDDLVSAGSVGLIQAVDRYDSGRNLKLKTLAEHRIRGAMLDYLRKLDPLPRSLRRFVRQCDQCASRLEGSLGRPPEEVELAEALGLSIDRYRRLQVSVRAARTLSQEALLDELHPRRR